MSLASSLSVDTRPIPCRLGCRALVLRELVQARSTLGYESFQSTPRHPTLATDSDAWQDSPAHEIIYPRFTQSGDMPNLNNRVKLSLHVIPPEHP